MCDEPLPRFVTPTKHQHEELSIQQRADMDNELARLMEKNVSEVFGQPARTLRKVAIADIYVEDCVSVEADDEFVGRDGIDARAEGILELAPGCVLRPTGRAEIIGDLGLLRWRLGVPGAPPAITGVDVALFHNRKIRTLYTFIDPQSLYTFWDQLPNLLRRRGYKIQSAF
jgi:hypothetical protein